MKNSRFNTKALLSLVVVFVLSIWTTGCTKGYAANPETIVQQWNFDTDSDAERWNTSHLSEPKVSSGTFKSLFTGRDPFIVSPQFDIQPKPGLILEIKMRSESDWKGELFFTGTNEGAYNGFLQEKSQTWDLNNDGEWHTYRIFPNWLSEEKIIKIRIDFGVPTDQNFGKTGIEVDSIRIIDLGFSNAPEVIPDWTKQQITREWAKSTEVTGHGTRTAFQSPIFRFDADQYGSIVHLEMEASESLQSNQSEWDIPEVRHATLRFISSVTGGVFEKMFKWNENASVCNIDLSDDANWGGQIYQIELVSEAPELPIRRLCVASEPMGAGCLEVQKAYPENAINRTDESIPIMVEIKNMGGSAICFDTFGELQSEHATLENDRTEILSPSNHMTQNVVLLPFETLKMRLFVHSDQEVNKEPIRFVVRGTCPSSDIVGNAECVHCTFDIPLTVTSSLHLPKADYVPEPQPVKSEFEIGALYFPGWAKRDAWERIRSTYPERKPVLGWYDESNPEVVDWQIKWATENGIQFFLVDWYWSRGSQHLDHWIQAFEKAKYKSYLKWAVMWANHNGPGTHSEEDQREVTQFWIDHYFKTPEYYTIDGKPVVMIWDPNQMDLDIIAIEAQKGHTLQRGEGVKKLLDLSRKMAIDAGLPGIFFITMKWPEASTRAEDIQWLCDAGFDMTSIYHFMDHRGKTENSLRFPFDLVVDASLPYWDSREKTGILPWLPNLSTGWDSRPWHGDKQTVIYDRTPDKFRSICEQFKSFAKQTGHRRVLLAPVNEWGEGSYIEPNAEFGFEMYETLRDVFCQKPEGGFPQNYTPADVGLGPYDLPPLPESKQPSTWDFTNTEAYETSVQDGESEWVTLMGIKNLKVEEGVLRLETMTNDPAIQTQFAPVFAKKWKGMTIRMRVTDAGIDSNRQEIVQLFWKKNGQNITESCSAKLPLIADGQFHDYPFNLEKLATWRGQITGFRLDPLNRENVTVEIQKIELY